MNRDYAIDILLNEIECVKRANYCDRDCGKCTLLKKDSEIIEALEMGIHFIKVGNKHKKDANRFKRKWLELKRDKEEKVL